jgi:TDG/mug DNA glycosylase family protein
VAETRTRRPAAGEAASGGTPDLLAPGLDAIFVGINPGLLSARVGHNFANPANGFWRLMHESGLVPRRLAPEEEGELLGFGLGLTNLAARPTAGVADLGRDDLERGRARLARRLARLRPRAVVFVGLTAYRAFARKTGAIACGEQAETVAGARVFVVPNPSGRNAHYRYEQMLDAFRLVARALGR